MVLYVMWIGSMFEVNLSCSMLLLGGLWVSYFPFLHHVREKWCVKCACKCILMYRCVHYVWSDAIDTMDR